MISRSLFLLSLAISILAIISSHNHDHAASGEEKSGSDHFKELQAYKFPIVWHALNFLTTMYDGKHKYKMEEGPTGEQQPIFCHRHECPKFKVLCSNAFYEVRKYAPAKYVTTTITCDSESDGDPFIKGFNRLVSYFRGQNDQSARLNITRPLAFQSRPSKIQDDKLKSSTHAKHAEVYLYVPSHYKDSTPVPLDSQLKVIDVPEHVVYVRMFGGIMLKHLWKPKQARFYDVLKGFNQTINPNLGAIGLTYDKPSVLLNRHNEIFYVAGENKEDSQYCRSN